MKNQIYELPICIDNVECVTECWTFNRMAILKTLPYYEDWIASHYELYATSNYNFFFGQLRLYAPEYYDMVLERRFINLFELTQNNVVDRLKDELSKGYYLNMYFKPFEDEDWYHEVLIFGFNDKDMVFYCIGLENQIFKEKSYDYTYVEGVLEIVKAHIKKTNKGLLALCYQNVLSAFKPKEDYWTGNCVFEAYNKIINELRGEGWSGHVLNDYGDYSKNAQCYKGISCLEALMDMLNKLIVGECIGEDFRGITNAFKKIYEHRYMMTVSLKYVLRNWEKAMKTNAKVYVLRYEECCNITQKWVGMAIKYEITSKTEILEKILAEIPEVFEKEYRCLNEFVNNSIDWEKFYEYYV